jgi:hypothetical protein
MSQRHWITSIACGLGLALLVACASCSSSDIEDGEACEENGECSSGRCVGGTCEGSDCTCEGSTCRSRSNCREGWLCTRVLAQTDQVLPICRQECTGVGTCGAGKQCDNGICREGGEPFALSWLNIPRARACAARVPCEYKVRPSEGVTVATYTWTFGGAPPVETTEPTASVTYEKSGSYDVLVRARSTSGAFAELRTTDLLCAGGLGTPCDPGGAPCCEGACGASLVCR